jgi:hypothetical protein
MPQGGVFLPALYRLVGRNQLQRPAALFTGQDCQVAERLLAAGTVAEYRQELLNWGMTTASLNANRAVLQRILFLLMQNLMLEEEKLGSLCPAPTRFKGDTSDTIVRATLAHSVGVLNSGTIFDLKQELQLWGLLHEHLNSGRLVLCILLKLCLRNLELSKLLDNALAVTDAPIAAVAVLTPPKHQAESPATLPIAKRLCVDMSDDSSSFALSHSISPILLCAALQYVSQLSGSQGDDTPSTNSQSLSTSASSCSTQTTCNRVQTDTAAHQSHCDSDAPTCRQGEHIALSCAAAALTSL